MSKHEDREDDNLQYFTSDSSLDNLTSNISIRSELEQNLKFKAYNNESKKKKYHFESICFTRINPMIFRQKSYSTGHISKNSNSSETYMNEEYYTIHIQILENP